MTTKLVNVRGACGAGKSTLVRKVLDDLRDRSFGVEPVRISGKRKPIGYEISQKRLFVAGHYEIQNGGLDTIGSMPMAHRWIEKYARREGWRVLFEGMNNKYDGEWIGSRAHDIVVIFLGLSLQTCEDGFAAKGQSRGVNYVERTWNKAAVERRDYEKMGVRCRLAQTRDDALRFTREELDL